MLSREAQRGTKEQQGCLEQGVRESRAQDVEEEELLVATGFHLGVTNY